MIKILIKYEGNKFDSLEVKGHANSAPHGQDLVCAGVSAILIGGLNNLDNVKSFDIKIEEGYTSVKRINEISAHDEIVLQTIVCGLKTIEESYGDFIKIQNL